MRELRRKLLTATLLPSVVAAGLVVAGPPATAKVRLTQVSSDPYTDAGAQHRSELGPDTFSFGNNIVSAFQVGRRRGSAMGASNVGFVTSTDGGGTWTSGFLPGITVNAGGLYQALTDPAVAYDAKHDVWLISTLALDGPAGEAPVLTSRSTDGGRTWGAPVVTVTGSADKNWIVCDNYGTSPYYGNCYTQYGDNPADELRMTTSSDGGRTWGLPRAAGDHASGSSGQPVVVPSGAVLVPHLNQGDTEVRSFASVDGGASWNASVLVSTLRHHHVAGDLREYALPSAEVDGAGTIYLVWSDCRFRTGCASNDIVLSTSTGDNTWTAPVRVPIDPVSGPAEHFVPGVGVDPSTSGESTRIALTYFYYPDADCRPDTCRLNIGYVSSTNGGTSWSPSRRLAGPMRLSWLPDTPWGRMFGEYVSTSVLAGGDAFPVVPVAKAPSGDSLDVAMYVPAGGLAVRGGRIPVGS